MWLWFLGQIVFQVLCWYLFLRIAHKTEELDGELFLFSLLNLIPIPIIGGLVSLILLVMSIFCYLQEVDFFENFAKKLNKKWSKKDVG